MSGESDFAFELASLTSFCTTSGSA
ncbi:MAG: hypothetical protein QOJ72_1976, partial [Nocardioidaceae bacterium]|nr:hypothetical protein [Nocardioidaceae bacterium]